MADDVKPIEIDADNDHASKYDRPMRHERGRSPGRNNEHPMGEQIPIPGLLFNSESWSLVSSDVLRVNSVGPSRIQSYLRVIAPMELPVDLVNADQRSLVKLALSHPRLITRLEALASNLNTIQRILGRYPVFSCSPRSTLRQISV